MLLRIIFTLQVWLACISFSNCKHIKKPNVPQNSSISITEGKFNLRQSGCRVNFNFDSEGQTADLDSPNYPSTYPPNVDCQYFITSPPGTQMKLTCWDFDVENSDKCIYDMFYFSQTGDKFFNDRVFFCGRGNFERSSVSNQLSIGFRSDSSNEPPGDNNRYKCTIKVLPIPDQLCSCGFKNENTRIVGGVEAKPGAYPWRCSLYTDKLDVFCGCSIISKNWILTAAHCTNAVGSGEILYVNVGDHDLTDATEAANQLIRVTEIRQNTNYNTGTQDSDTSLLRLSRPLTYARNIQPVCLPFKFRNADFSGTTITASGWGLTKFGGTQSKVLMEVDLPVLTTNECRQYYPTQVTNNMICTYTPNKDTCQGDSGGSIDYRDPQTGQYYAIGVVSWGIGCATNLKPGVYAKVTNFLDWIETNTGETFCKA